MPIQTDCFHVVRDPSLGTFLGSRSLSYPQNPSFGLKISIKSFQAITSDPITIRNQVSKSY
ncbi:hypothetical protein QQP08_012153 [Theobroma cacao]|nr:hypothetical protein QQP08_012153 [Theobroma cacao]